MIPKEMVLELEGGVFTAFLIGARPTPYVVEKYCEAHRVRGELLGDDRFESWLVAFARRGPFAAGIADAYARAFLPNARLRKKLVVLLAILETSPPFCDLIDPPDSRRVASLAVGVGLRLAQWASFLVLGFLFCQPARLFFAAAKTLGWRRSG